MISSLVKLKDVATIIAGQSPPGKNYNNNGEGMPFYQGKKDYGDKFLNPPKVWTKSITKVAIKGDILLSVRAPVGALNIATQEICIGRGLAAIRVHEEINEDYLFYVLSQISIGLTGNAGAIFNSINKTQIENIEFLLPPLAEQERIVAKLDAAFAEIDRGIKTTKAKESEISRLNTSILSKTLTEHNHKIVKLGSIATVIAGQSPKGEYYNKEGRGTPFYQGKKDYGKRYLNEPKVWTDKVTKLAEKDDILLSVRAPIGALNIATQQICIGRGLAAIRPSTKILNDYLFYSLLLISNKLEGSSGAIFNSINKSQIEALEVTLPSIEEQQNIVDKLDAALEKIKLTEYSNEAIIKNFIKLKSAILSQELQSSEAA
ncbi:restriction endonuclease subunit S [Gammaproteobacteria bacterium]|nr:restriction endonuclease subunit S [Gammaproteobacteria bacterium]